MLWIVYFESNNYAGYGEHRLVEAETAEQAIELIEPVAEDLYMEEDRDQLEEDGYDLDDCVFASIVSVEPFNEDHEYWDFRDSTEKVN